MEKAKKISGVKEVRGLGLMIGIEMEFDIAELRKKLLFEHKIFVGYAGNTTLRLLPALNIQQQDMDKFLDALQVLTQKQTAKI